MHNLVPSRKKLKYRNLTREKMKRKINHLRTTSYPSSKSEATRFTWYVFFNTLYKLKLTKIYHGGF